LLQCLRLMVIERSIVGTPHTGVARAHERLVGCVAQQSSRLARMKIAMASVVLPSTEKAGVANQVHGLANTRATWTRRDGVQLKRRAGRCTLPYAYFPRG
jgi:hypothetical protein